MNASFFDYFSLFLIILFIGNSVQKKEVSQVNIEDFSLIYLSEIISAIVFNDNSFLEIDQIGDMALSIVWLIFFKVNFKFSRVVFWICSFFISFSERIISNFSFWGLGNQIYTFALFFFILIFFIRMGIPIFFKSEGLLNKIIFTALFFHLWEYLLIFHMLNKKSNWYGSEIPSFLMYFSHLIQLLLLFLINLKPFKNDSRAMAS